MTKRLFDLLVSAVALIVLSPVLLVFAWLIKRHDGGPVFYRGRRVGLNGRVFEMLKFRTMVLNADKMGASSTAEDDPRITAVGHTMRRYKIDELPQLINVLRGEMSIVGPRPQVEWAVALYSERERALLSVRPGITDYASIRFRNEGEILAGSADPDRDYLEKIAPEKIRLGLLYVETHTLMTDLRIIAATAYAVFGGDPERLVDLTPPSTPVAASAS